jgi:hypothetical protein
MHLAMHLEDLKDAAALALAQLQQDGDGMATLLNDRRAKTGKPMHDEGLIIGLCGLAVAIAENLAEEWDQSAKSILQGAALGFARREDS